MELYVVFGGKSSEHEVSIQSALNILENASRSNYRVFAAYIATDGNWSVFPLEGEFDRESILNRLNLLPRLAAAEAVNAYLSTNSPKVVFPIIHGTGGEDGRLQGLCETLQIPYVGCGVTASAIGMDKAIMKCMMTALGIPVAPYLSFSRADYASNPGGMVQQIEQHISYPCFVKPARGGSSIGVTRVADSRHLLQAVQDAFAEDSKIMVEKEIVGREIEIGLLGGDKVECSLPGEFVRQPSFFDYHCKYLDKDLAMRIPALVPESTYRLMCEYATAVFREFDCHGLFRADFFLTDTGEVFFNEINTLPGFTQYSMYPSVWAKAGVNLTSLIDRLVDLALQRRQAQQHVRAGVMVSD